MHVNINISQEVEAVLRREWGDLDQAAKDALLIESYRAGYAALRHGSAPPARHGEARSTLTAAGT